MTRANSMSIDSVVLIRASIAVSKKEETHGYDTYIGYVCIKIYLLIRNMHDR